MNWLIWAEWDLIWFLSNLFEGPQMTEVVNWCYIYKLIIIILKCWCCPYSFDISHSLRFAFFWKSSNMVLVVWKLNPTNRTEAETSSSNQTAALVLVISSTSHIEVNQNRKSSLWSGSFMWLDYPVLTHVLLAKLPVQDWLNFPDSSYLLVSVDGSGPWSTSLWSTSAFSFMSLLLLRAAVIWCEKLVLFVCILLAVIVSLAFVYGLGYQLCLCCWSFRGCKLRWYTCCFLSDLRNRLGWSPFVTFSWFFSLVRPVRTWAVNRCFYVDVVGPFDLIFGLVLVQSVLNS